MEKIFDKIKLKEALNDLWDSGVKNDKFAMLYELNKNSTAKVLTPVGESDVINLEENVLQGGSWGPLKASNQMDTFGKEAKNEGEFVYMYQGVVPITMLQMVDDTLAVAECGPESKMTNAYVNTKVEMKNLRFGVDKQGYRVLFRRSNQIH